jgi:hypothetical protein
MRIFGPKRDKVIVELREQHSEELSDLYKATNTFGRLNEEE